MPLAVVLNAPDLITIDASGVLARAEVDQAKRQVFGHMMVHGHAHVLIRIADNFGNLQAFASWDDIDEDRFIKQHIVRLAIVGDLRWRDNALLFLLSGLVPFQIEYFKPEQITLARAWLNG
jgi:hypothetical protein